MTDSAATPRVRGMQRAALALLVVAGVVNYIDRATLAIANPLVRHDLGLSIADMGVLLSAFLWAYAFAQLPAGALADRLGPRILLTLGLTLWSGAQVLGGLVRSLNEFFLARVLLGLGEGPQYPTCARVVRDWFNVRERGLATGIFNCSSTLGTAIAAPLLTVLMLEFGWRWMFMLMGFAGLVVAAAWYLVYRDPARMNLDAAERRHLVAGDANATVQLVSFRTWRQLFRFRTTWGLILGYFGTIYVTWIYTAWLPGYLELERHMSIRSTGIAAAIPYACGVVGSVFGGVTADWLMARGFSAVDSRRYPMAIALGGTAVFTLLAALVASNILAIACISAAIFLVFVTSTAAWATASVAAPSSYTASLGSIQNFGGYIGGALAPTVTGIIVQRTGSFVPALLVGAAIACASAIIYFTVVREPITGDDLMAAAAAPAAAGN